MSAPGQNNVDLDALLDLTEYDGLQSHSPSLSPPGNKVTYTSPVSAVTATPSIPSTSTQTLSGPSHNYDMYRQQTGFVPGALANTMAVNQTNNTGYQDFGSLEYLPNMSPQNDIFDFSTTPPQSTLPGTEMDMDFNSAADSQEFFSTINPSNIEHEASVSPSGSTQSNVGRLWPGAHSQAAHAKAQAQQRQQQQVMQQQQQQVQPRPAQQPQKARSKGTPPTDPLVEQKITQLLNSMRAKPASPESETSFSHTNLPKAKKEEEEMDEDERLLASEEGKKLSSKERRQLRNKVSARAFRSRRKEYITQLEAEIASKVNENGDLRAQNRALVDENKRLTDLTRMLLASPSFSNFLDHLSANPSSIPPPATRPALPQQQQQQQQPPQPQQSQQRQMPKDISPYDAQQQQIGIAMIPEQTMDFSMLSIAQNPYASYQPQVFVVDTPEVPSIDTNILSGKSSNFVEPLLESDEDKAEVPVIEHLISRPQPATTKTVISADSEFDADPEFALFHTSPATTSEPVKELDTEGLINVDIFSGIESEKILARYELVDASEEEASAIVAMARVQRISDNIESVVSRLELLTRDL